MLGGVPLSILIVEDDADTRNNLRDILELDGCCIDEAVTVAEALDRANRSTYSTILLDRKLPDGTAFDLLPQLKRLAPAADVIILTGFADVDGAISALRQGAADYLLKPINPDELRARIVRLAEHRRAEEELQQRSLILQSVLKQVTDAAIVVDLHGKVLLHSPAVERLIGPIRVGALTKDLSALGSIYRPDTVNPYALEDLPLSRALKGEEVIDEEVFVKSPGDRSGHWMSATQVPSAVRKEFRERSSSSATSPSARKRKRVHSNPSVWRRSERWSPGSLTRVAMRCNGARPVSRCSPWRCRIAPGPGSLSPGCKRLRTTWHTSTKTCGTTRPPSCSGPARAT